MRHIPYAMLRNPPACMGYREILGIRMGDTESYVFWNETFQWLKRRGLSGVDFVVSDAHAGLIEAAERQFQGAMIQRCQVHLMRNVLAKCSPHMTEEISRGMKRIFAAETEKEARMRFDELADALGGRQNGRCDALRRD